MVAAPAATRGIGDTLALSHLAAEIMAAKALAPSPQVSPTTAATARSPRTRSEAPEAGNSRSVPFTSTNDV
ncbi:hypothetical protein BH24ACT4_BH24ACT4_10020 [soil metagenome]